jgi:coiled-coil domain-containing protein 151
VLQQPLLHAHPPCHRQLEKDEETLSEVREDSQHAQQVRSIENRLEKANIKLQEAVSIQRTYVQIIERLQSERLMYDKQVYDLQEAIRIKQAELDQLVSVGNDAALARDSARADMEAFEAKLLEDRKQRERDLHQRKQMVKEVLEATEKMERRQQELLLEQRQESTTNIVTKADPDIGNKVYSYEEAFRKIGEATGITDYADIINRFSSQDQTRAQLLRLRQENEERIVKLKEEKSALQAELNSLKFSSDSQVGSRQVVEEFEQRLRQTQETRDNAVDNAQRLARTLADCVSGAQHLVDKVRPSAGPGSAVAKTSVVAEERLPDAVAALESDLVRILSIVEDHSAALQAIAGPPPPIEVVPPVHNIRVALPDVSDLDRGGHAAYDSDSDDNYPDEDVPDRDVLKRRATQTVNQNAGKKQSASKADAHSRAKARK